MPARAQVPAAGGREAGPGQAADADQLHVRRHRLRRRAGDGRMPGHQARPGLPVGRGVVRLRQHPPGLSPAHRRARIPHAGRTATVTRVQRRNPATGIRTVTWRIREGGDPGYTLVDLADRAAQPRLAGARLHPHRCRLDSAVQRIVARLGVSRAPASLLLDDFRDAVARFRRHAVAVSMTKGGIRRTQPPNAGSRLSRPLLTCSQCLAGLVRRFVKLLRLVSVSMRPGAGATVARPAIRRCVIGHATCVAAVSGGRQAPR